MTREPASSGRTDTWAQPDTSQPDTRANPGLAAAASSRPRLWLAEERPAAAVEPAPKTSMLGKRFTPLLANGHHLPEEGPVLVVSNHIGSLDGMFLRQAIARDATVLGLNPVTTAVRRMAVWQDPVDQVISAAWRAFDAGKVVVIFPETLPSPDGAIHRGNTTVARVILDYPVPVIPAVISEVLDSPSEYGRKLVEFGPRIRMSRWYHSDIPDEVVERTITDSIMYTLMEMSGRPYSDVDAGITRMQQELAAKRAARAGKPTGIRRFFREKVWG